MGYSHGQKWNEKLIKKGILNVMNCFGISRMPTNSECRAVYGNSGLAVAISRIGGFRYWAGKLNLDLKECDTFYGQKYEDKARNFIEEITKLKCIKMTTRHPYDFWLENGKKIDVKVSKLHKGPNGNFYTFNLGKKYPTCDIYFLYCIVDDNTERIMVVPSKDALICQLSIGEHKSKWYKYEKNFDLLK